MRSWCSRSGPCLLSSLVEYGPDPLHLVELLDLCPDDFSGQRQIPAFTLHAVLALLTENEANELFDLRLDRLARLTVEVKVVFTVKRIGAVVNRFKRTLYIRPPVVGLNRQFLQFWTQRHRRNIKHGVLVIFSRVPGLRAPGIDLVIWHDVVRVSLVVFVELVAAA